MRRCTPQILPSVVLAVVVCSAPAAAQSPEEISQKASQAMVAQNYAEAERQYVQLTKMVPNVPELYSNLGIARYNQKKFPAAQAAFETALRLNRNLFVPNFFLATIFAGDGKYTLALLMAQKALQIQSTDKPARRLLANVYLGLKRESQAIAQYQKLLDEDPRDVDSLSDLAMVYLGEGQAAFEKVSTYKGTGFPYLVNAELDSQREGFSEAAAEDYRKAITASPTVPGWRVALANELIQAQKWKDAGQALHDELTLDPFSYQSHFGLAQVAMQTGNCEAATREIDEAFRIRPEFFNKLPELAPAPPTDQLQSACSVFLLKSAGGSQDFGTLLLRWNLQGQADQTSTWAAQAEHMRDEEIRKFKAQANDSPTVFATGANRRKTGVELLQQKRYEHGLAVLSPLFAQNAEAVQVNLLALRALFELERYSDLLQFLDRTRLDNPEAYYLRGISCKKLALRLMNRIVEVDPQSVRTHQLIASIYEARQMYPEAVHEYETALAIQPDNPELYFALGTACFDGRKFGEAEKAFQHTVDLDPLHAEGHAMRGYALLELGKPENAIPEVRRALELNPGLVSAHGVLGRALADTGQVNEAVHHLELASSTDKDGSLHYQLYRLYQRLGQTDKSKQALLISEKIRQARRQAMEESVVIRAPAQNESRDEGQTESQSGKQSKNN